MLTLALNEDSSHFFCWHSREEMSCAGLDAWLDQYAGTEMDLVITVLESSFVNWPILWKEADGTLELSFTEVTIVAHP